MDIPDGNLKQIATRGKKEEVQNHHQIWWITQHPLLYRVSLPKLSYKMTSLPLQSYLWPSCNKMGMEIGHQSVIRRLPRKQIQGQGSTHWDSHPYLKSLKGVFLHNSILGFQSSLERFQSSTGKNETCGVITRQRHIQKNCASEPVSFNQNYS